MKTLYNPDFNNSLNSNGVVNEHVYNLGSCVPSIAFCLTNPPDKILDFIRYYQRHTPIFRENFEDHRLTCETIIRTDDITSYKYKLTGIDDCYIFDNINAPLNSRSVFELHYSFEDLMKNRIVNACSLDALNSDFDYKELTDEINKSIVNIIKFENFPIITSVFKITLNQHRLLQPIKLTPPIPDCPPTPCPSPSPQALIEDTEQLNCKVMETNPEVANVPSLL